MSELLQKKFHQKLQALKKRFVLKLPGRNTFIVIFGALRKPASRARSFS